MVRKLLVASAVLALAYIGDVTIYSTLVNKTEREDAIGTNVTRVSPLTPWNVESMHRMRDKRDGDVFAVDSITITHDPIGIFGLTNYRDGGWQSNKDNIYDGKVDEITVLPPLFGILGYKIGGPGIIICSGEFRKGREQICDAADKIFSQEKYTLEEKLPK